jgi:hypothetical protein
MRAYALATLGCYSVLHLLCLCVHVAPLPMCSSLYVVGNYVRLGLFTYRALFRVTHASVLCGELAMPLGSYWAAAH